MYTRTRLVSVALASTLLIAACSSDDDGAGTTAAMTEPSVAVTTPASTADTVPNSAPDTTDAMTEDTTATTDATTQDVAADTAAAQDALLTVADFPEGWSAPSTGVNGVSEIQAGIAECIGVDSLTSSPARATTGNFSSPDGSLVVSEAVGVQASVQDARIIMGSITNPDVLDCVAAAYTDLGVAALTPGAVADGAAIGDISVSRLAVGTAGNATQAIRVVIPVTSGDAATQVTVDQVFLRAERSVAWITFEGRLAATPVETIDAITAAAASRLPV